MVNLFVSFFYKLWSAIHIFIATFFVLVIENCLLLSQLLQSTIPVTQFKIISNVFGNWIFVSIAFTHLWPTTTTASDNSRSHSFPPPAAYPTWPTSPSATRPHFTSPSRPRRHPKWPTCSASPWLPPSPTSTHSPTTAALKQPIRPIHFSWCK